MSDHSGDALTFTPRCACGIFLSRDYEKRRQHTGTCPAVRDEARRDSGLDEIYGVTR